MVLALTNEGAKGNTSAELEKALFLPSSNEKTHKALKSLLPNLKINDEHLKLLSANKIYADKSLLLVDDFKTIAATVYDTGNIDNRLFNRVEKRLRPRMKFECYSAKGAILSA